MRITGNLSKGTEWLKAPRKTAVSLIISDSEKIAQTDDADGVPVGQDDLPAGIVCTLTNKDQGLHAWPKRPK